MSAERRINILIEYFRQNGWIGRLPEDYKYYMSKIEDEMGYDMLPPTLSPDQCIARGMTYEYSFMVNSNTCLFTIPAMTKGGYFIIQGSEKVVLIQEVKLKTEILTTVERINSKNEDKEIIGDGSVSEASMSTLFQAGCVYPCCELLLQDAHVPIKVRLVDDSIIELDTSSIHNNLRGIKSIGMLEIFLEIFRLEDFEETSYILRSYCAEQSYRPYMQQNINMHNENLYNACMVYILASTMGTGALFPDEDRETIRQKMFGGMKNDRCIVATLVTLIVACVKAKLGNELSDRDDYRMKRFKSPGETVYSIFKYCLNSCSNINSLKKSVENHVHEFIKRGNITIGGRIYNKMSIQLSRRSDIDVLSSVRKVIVPCDENSPNVEMRQIHRSQVGFICPCETPEGKTVGIMKSLALTCAISTKTDVSTWVNEHCREKPFAGCAWVILDGRVVGWYDKLTNSQNSNYFVGVFDVKMFVHNFKRMYPTVSISVNANVIKLRAESGRPIRPLIAIDDRPVDWNDCSDSIQYLDPVECSQENSNIADMGYGGNWRMFTHMEIHPCTMLGLAVSLVPFPEHNQSARNVFSSSMIKQAMQMYGSDKTCDTLQKPLVYTAIGREVGYDESPNGINLVTCIMSLNGFNQEDAIIVKKSSVERGLFASTINYSKSVTVNNPCRVIEQKKTKTTTANFVRKIDLTTPNEENEYRLISVFHGGTEKALTDVAPLLSSKNPKIEKTTYSVDYKSGRMNIKFVMSAHQSLRVGDKLSSRHAQKGVVGMLMPDEDMPFTCRDGIIPDIIINPHAIPSRMTVGQLIEGVLGKSCAMTGTFEDGTPFLRSEKKDLNDIVNNKDTEKMILGTTGEMIETPIVMGIVYYMALRHQAADKIYVRSNSSLKSRHNQNAKSIMSRQPIAGRSKGGGLRVGEMEYDCLIAHGASTLVTEISENSDMVDVPYCDTCKIVTDVFDSTCRMCNTTKTVRKRVPFSYVIFKDLMLASNINMQAEL
jgi:DNA-directed RNA polymerase beta subunit